MDDEVIKKIINYCGQIGSQARFDGRSIDVCVDYCVEETARTNALQIPLLLVVLEQGDYLQKKSEEYCELFRWAYNLQQANKKASVDIQDMGVIDFYEAVDGVHATYRLKK